MIRITLPLCLILFMFSGCIKDIGPQPPPPPASACSGPPVTITVLVQDFVFNPASVNACVGDTIKWVYSAAVAHTTTSGTIPSGATAWNSPITSSVTEYKYVPAVAGTYNYVCTPHAPSMAGVLIIGN